MERWQKTKGYQQILNRLAIRRAEAMREIESACDRSVNLNSSSNGLITLPDSIGNLTNLTTLRLCRNQLVELPESIGNLTNLTTLNLYQNMLSSLPNTISNLTSLNVLNLGYNSLTIFPENISKLSNLTELYLHDNQLTKLPESISHLINLTYLSLSNNPLADLSILKNLPRLKTVQFLNIDLRRRYWTSLSDWKPEWLLDEDNAEIRRILIEHVGYDKIYDRLNAVTLDTWRDYQLLKIDGLKNIPDRTGSYLDSEPMILLKMTCPSINHLHILRVPPGMTSAEAAITWVNHGIHPDEFTIQT